MTKRGTEPDRSENWDLYLIEAKPGATEEKTFVVQVTTNFPYFFIGERPVTLDNLQSELAAAVKHDPQLKVAVKADRQAPFGEIVKVIDASKVAQASSINFVTEKPPPSGR